VRLLPFERLTLRTESPPDVVAAKLAKLVATGWYLLTTPPEPFRGSVRGRHFKIVRVLGTFLGLPFHNSWQPVIVGDVVSAPGGTEIRVRMRLSALAGTFTALWFSGFFWGAGLLLRVGLAEGFGPSFTNGREAAGAGVGLAVIGAMVLAGYAGVSVAFWTEVKKARSALREGLGCRDVDSRNRLLRL